MPNAKEWNAYTLEAGTNRPTIHTHTIMPYSQAKQRRGLFNVKWNRKRPPTTASPSLMHSGLYTPPLSHIIPTSPAPATTTWRRTCASWWSLSGEPLSVLDAAFRAEAFWAFLNRISTSQPATHRNPSRVKFYRKQARTLRHSVWNIRRYSFVGIPQALQW